MNPIVYQTRIDRAHPGMIFSPLRGTLLAAEVAMERWEPSRTYTKKEQFILKRLVTKRRLFAFLRNHRHEIFDEAFQEELETMYR